MLDLSYFETSPYFKKISLKKGDVLFDEGSVDNHIYIIESGSLSIEKYTTTEKQETKILASVGAGEVIGEASLNNTDAKQVKIIAQTTTQLLAIDANDDFETFLKHSPEKALELLKYIIDLGNKRLLKSNALITASYEINKTISELTRINYKSIFKIIQKFQQILGNSYILFLEQNPVVNNIATLKYDTRDEGKLKDYVVGLEANKNLLDIVSSTDTQLVEHNEIYKLNLGDIEIGYLIIGKESEAFSDTEKKIMSSVTNSLVGLIRHISLLKEEQDKDYLKGK